MAKDDEPEYEPGARNPVGVELVGRHSLEKLLLVLRHESGVDHVVQRREPLLHCGWDRPEDQGITLRNEQQEPENKDECEVHPANEASAQHPRLLVVARDVEGDWVVQLVRPGDETLLRYRSHCSGLWNIASLKLTKLKRNALIRSLKMGDRYQGMARNCCHHRDATKET